MWPFSDSRKLSTLEERVRSIESEQRALKAEWLLAYDKLVTLMGRIAKRVKVVEATEPLESEGQDEIPSEGTATVSDETSSRLFLTPRQRTIQAQVLRRRAARLEGGGP